MPGRRGNAAGSGGLRGQQRGGAASREAAPKRRRAAQQQQAAWDAAADTDEDWSGCSSDSSDSEAAAPAGGLLATLGEEGAAWITQDAVDRGVQHGDIAAVVGGEDGGSERLFWLLLVTSGPEELAAAETIDGQTFEAGATIVRGRWFEACGGVREGPPGSAYEFWLRDDAAAVYSHLIFRKSVPLAGEREVGGVRVVALDAPTEEILEAEVWERCSQLY